MKNSLGRYIQKFVILTVVLAAFAACAPSDKNSKVKKARSGKKTFVATGSPDQSKAEPQRPGISPNAATTDDCRITSVPGDLAKMTREQSSQPVCEALSVKVSADGAIQDFRIGGLHSRKKLAALDLTDKTTLDVTGNTKLYRAVAVSKNNGQPSQTLYLSYQLGHLAAEIKSTTIKVFRVNGIGEKELLSPEKDSYNIRSDTSGHQYVEFMNAESLTDNINFSIIVEYELSK